MTFFTPPNNPFNDFKTDLEKRYTCNRTYRKC